MEYLLDVQWNDPVARAVARILSTLPEGVEQTTASVPLGHGHGFTVLRAEDAGVLSGIANAIASAGADVQIVERKPA